MVRDSAKLNRRGTVTIPKPIRDAIGLVDGSLVVFEVTEEGVLMRPAIETPVNPEQYSALRKAELLLNNAIDKEDYARIREQVVEMGLDPDQVPHDRPAE
jgi:AbrB family looped-hinge helix DNA binding protein